LSHTEAAAAATANELRVPAGHPLQRLPLLGAALTFAGAVPLLIFGGADPERFFAAWLVAFFFFLSVALGCLYFVLIHTAMHGTWGLVVRRFAENAAATLPLFAVLFLPVAFGLHTLYHWSHADAVAHDALLQLKAPYLNERFFLIRAASYFAVWCGIALWFRSVSRRQDRGDGQAHATTLKRWSGALLIPLALTHTFAAFDWVMSLAPHWYSTIFGVYAFAGGLVAGFALITLASVGLRRAGLVPGLTQEHLHDLGKLLFAFTVFWAYIAFSQFFLIWYGNIPEETVFYRIRLAGGFRLLTVALAVGHFVLPFFFLLPRSIKRKPATLVGAALWLLAMHLLDVYWLVIPSVEGLGARPHVVDAAALLAVGGAFVAAFGWLMVRSPLVPKGDPRLQESLAFENV
jgi:hypothetical protein